jgi:hypothetical protein
MTMLDESLGPMQVEARLYRDYPLSGEYVRLHEKWRKDNADAPPAEFDRELREQLGADAERRSPPPLADRPAAIEVDL